MSSAASYMHPLSRALHNACLHQPAVPLNDPERSPAHTNACLRMPAVRAAHDRPRAAHPSSYVQSSTIGLYCSMNSDACRPSFKSTSPAPIKKKSGSNWATLQNIDKDATEVVNLCCKTW
eukprot:GHRQ01039155.1.p1 GENE.GHRQ01039155.1~~GHRQ01039155.1.p1  ORF type:complete len:120 (+),score=15.97 GHRQ01039155.1:58-417(+)